MQSKGMGKGRYDQIFENTERCKDVINPTVDRVWLATSSRSFWVNPI